MTKRIVALCITATFIVALLCVGMVPNNLHLPFALPSFAIPATLTTNGANQWENDDLVTAPVLNFSTPSSNTLSVSPPFTHIYQTYGNANNSLGTPLTTGFPTTDGWLQFFTNGALLLPPTPAQDSDTPLTYLAKNGVRDPATGIIRLPLIQTLLGAGSQLPVGGHGSTLTYVDLRKAAIPELMRPISTTSQGVFVQGGTRRGKAVGHLVQTTFWNYINQPDISPHSWQKDFGAPLTEALTFTLPVNGQTHHMLIQVFTQEALLLDQDAGGNTNDTTGQAAIQPLPIGADYLSTVGMPTVTAPANKVVWALSDTALLNQPGSGRQIAHVGQTFPLRLVGNTRWLGGVPWYYTQWSVPKQSQKGWISATALTFNLMAEPRQFLEIDVLAGNA